MPGLLQNLLTFTLLVSFCLISTAVEAPKIHNVHDLTDRELSLMAAISRTVPEEEKRVCVFLHGSGNKDEGNETDTFTGYWGNVHQFTPQCSERIFNHDDTTNFPFDNERLMRRFCDTATGEEGGAVISNRIVFTHSMGGNVLAAAIKHGYCDLDSTSSWYDASAPLAGSKAAVVIDKICQDPSAWDEPLRWLAKELHYCKDGSAPGNASAAYLSMLPSYPGLEGLVDIAARRVKGSLCGTSPLGLYSIYSVALGSVAEVVQFGEENDGLVGIDSCVLPSAEYANKFESDWYRAPLNHADTTCRNGNGYFDKEERMPCGWYSLRI